MPEISDLIGTPFEKLPCWELVREYYKRCGIDIPEYYDIEHSNMDNVNGYKKLDDPEVGSICIYSLNGHDLDHAGIYLGDNQLLHSTTFSGVCIERYSKFIPRLKGVYRYGSCNNHHQSI